MLFNEVLEYEEGQEGNIYSFYTEELPLPLLNSIRRTIMTEYETYSISSDITVIKNTSVLNDDFLKHRLTMIPLLCNEEIELELNVLNNTSETIDVLSYDIKNYDSKKYVMNEDILVAKLRQGEEIFVKMKVDYNNGSHNVRYRPSNVIICKKMRVLLYKGDDEKMKEEIFDFMEERYDMKRETRLNDDAIVGVLDTAKTTVDYINVLKRHLGINPQDLLIEEYAINNKPVIYFMIECDYYHPKEVFYNSLRYLRNRMQKMYEKRNLTKTYDNKYFYDIQEDCATTGNLIQYFLNELPNVEYSFFIKKFPTDKNIELQIFLKNNDDVEKVLKSSFDTTMECIRKLELSR